MVDPWRGMNQSLNTLAGVSDRATQQRQNALRNSQTDRQIGNQEQQNAFSRNMANQQNQRAGEQHNAQMETMNIQKDMQKLKDISNLVGGVTDQASLNVAVSTAEQLYGPKVSNMIPMKVYGDDFKKFQKNAVQQLDSLWGKAKKEYERLDVFDSKTGLQTGSKVVEKGQSATAAPGTSFSAPPTKKESTTLPYEKDKAKMIDDTRGFYGTKIRALVDENGFVKDGPAGDPMRYQKQFNELSDQMQSDMAAISDGFKPSWLKRKVDKAKEPVRSEVMDEMPNAAEHKGKTIKDNETGKRYKSDGKTWNLIK